MPSVVICYARADEAVARELAEYIRVNLPFEVSCDEGVIGPGFDLLEATERALSAEVALVLLSPASVPKVWDRKTWEPVFIDTPKKFQTLLGFVLVSECRFPALLRREKFFEADTAAREIKRWLLRPFESLRPAGVVAEELRGVVDRPGIVVDRPGIVVGGDPGEECAEDFEAVYRFDCRGRTRVGLMGDVCCALGLQGREALIEWCRGHRVLFVMTGVGEHDWFAPGGLASVILTDGELAGCVQSGAADAVRSFHRARGGDALRAGWIAVRILKVQERAEEVAEVLAEMARLARGDGDAVAKIERELFWIEGASAEAGPLVIHEGEQLALPFA
jgi:hypothetical protein